MVEFVVTLGISIVLTLAANFLVGSLFLRPRPRGPWARQRSGGASSVGKK